MCVEISNNTEHVQYKNSNIRDEFFEINQVVSDGLVNCNTPFIVCNTKSEHQDMCSKWLIRLNKGFVLYLHEYKVI